MSTLAKHRREHGAVTVEFALMFPLLMLVVGFMLALGLRTFWSALADYATRDMARYAGLQKTTTYYPNRTDVVKDGAAIFGGTLGTPTVTLTETAATTLTPAYDQDASFDSRLGEGDTVTVTTTWNVPGLSALVGIVKGLPVIGFDMSGFATVTHTASARRE